MAVTTDPALAAQAGGRVMALRSGLFLTPFGQLMFASPLKWVVMLAPLALVFFLSFRVYKMSVGAAQISFWRSLRSWAPRSRRSSWCSPAHRSRACSSSRQPPSAR